MIVEYLFMNILGPMLYEDSFIFCQKSFNLKTRAFPQYFKVGIAEMVPILFSFVNPMTAVTKIIRIGTTFYSYVIKTIDRRNYFWAII